MTKDVQIGIRLEPEHVEQLDALVEAFKAKYGMDASRSLLARTAMLKGFEALRAELQLAKPRKKKRE